MRTTGSPAATAPGLTDDGRLRRLELLLGVIETLEAPGSLAARIRRALRLLVDAGMGEAAGMVAADEAERPAVGPAAAAVAGPAGRLAEAAARAGEERREPVGEGEEVLAVPMRAAGRVEGALWLAAPGDAPEERALARDVADRLARAIATERARREQVAQAAELRRSDALKTALLRGVTHELRTPLAGIANAADALRVIDDPAERAELLRDVIGETHRLERVVSNLLDLSRVEGGVLAARMEWCVLEELVGSGLAASASFLDGVEVATEIADDAPLVRADPVLTERILINLLHNAVRHGRPPVAVTARRAAAGVELSVIDAGPGVDPMVLPSVFEPFVHREGVGLGLGLPLCRRLAEAQDARLEHRAPPSGGTCFTIVFPPGSPPEVDR